MEENPELNAFRRQWREEVSRRNKPASTASRPAQHTTAPDTGLHRMPAPPVRREAADRKEDDLEEDLGRDYGEFVSRTEHLTLRAADEDSFQRLPQKEPQSALEHFEKAVEREAEGNLGDSLAHYRKAYRLDAAIDKKYRNKHFANKPSGHVQTAKSAEPGKEKPDEIQTLPTPELILSFANEPILQAEPIIEGDIPPPCPISKISNDVLIEILKHIATIDPASFCRMALVCKRFAFHFAHEQHIWRSLCQGRDFGFTGMHYSFDCDLLGNPSYSFKPRYTPFPPGAATSIPEGYSSWSHVFQTFPRIRFTGIYISTVNYTRPGGASTYTNATWNDPIHIVTYYRYLRFYPDGSVISLLSTTEPVDVVPHITKENVAAARPSNNRQHHHHHHHHKKGSVAASHEPSTPVPALAMQTLKTARWGRWHLTPPESEEVQDPQVKDDVHSSPQQQQQQPAKDNPTAENDPRNVVIETEGADPKYTYILYLTLRSTNPARAAGSTKNPPNVSKNTKLVWRSFWSYNKLTDDLAEFRLRNDRSFVFRRVRGWGL